MSIVSRIDALTEIPEGWLSAILPAPPSMKIELTNRCNLRCQFCALRTREGPSNQDMDWDLFVRIATGAREAGVEELGLFFLGESFSAPDLLVRACRFAKQDLGFPYVFLTSNAVAARPWTVQALMHAGLDSLKWSVNAADPQQYEEMMGVSAKNMEQALHNIKSAWERRSWGKYKTKLYASSIAFDGEQGERMKALIEEKIAPYVDEHYFLPLYQMAMNAGRLEADTGFAPTHGNSGRIDPETGKPNRKPLPCWSAFREAHVRVDGAMSACCFGSDERFDVGDLKEQSFMDAWNSMPMRHLRSAQLRTISDGPEALKGTPCDVCVAYG